MAMLKMAVTVLSRGWTRNFCSYCKCYQQRISVISSASKTNVQSFALFSRRITLSFSTHHLFASVTVRPITSSTARWNGRKMGNQHISDAKFRSKTTLNYMLALIITVVGFSYAAVPLYRVFCQVTGIGGSGNNLAQHGGEKVENLQKVTDRKLRIIFNADVSSRINWKFKPLQKEVLVYPGETALAFYSAENPTEKPIVGISTYTILPYEAAKYLNKIQCFCFEEQRLNPHEQVDMPVFFYIDPEFCNDPLLANADVVTLSYMFFEAKDGSKFLPQQNQSPMPAVVGGLPSLNPA